MHTAHHHSKPGVVREVLGFAVFLAGAVILITGSLG